MPQTLVLEGPRRLRLSMNESRPLQPGEVRLRSRLSGISHGTELSLYRGTSAFTDRVFDRGLRAFVAPHAGAASAYPVTLGYEMVSEVIEVAPGVSKVRVGDLVHTGPPHQEETVLDVAASLPATYPLVVLPTAERAERGLLISLAAVALQAPDAVRHCRARVRLLPLIVSFRPLLPVSLPLCCLYRCAQDVGTQVLRRHCPSGSSDAPRSVGPVAAASRECHHMRLALPPCKRHPAPELLEHPTKTRRTVRDIPHVDNYPYADVCTIDCKLAMVVAARRRLPGSPAWSAARRFACGATATFGGAVCSPGSSRPGRLTTKQARATLPLRSARITGHHRYYEPVRPCAPHRYSAPRSFRCLGYSLRPAGTRPAPTGRQVACQRLNRARAAFVPGHHLASRQASGQAHPGVSNPRFYGGF
jgi:hypothetical protein